MSPVTGKGSCDSQAFRIGLLSFAAGASPAIVARLTAALDPDSPRCLPLHHSNCGLLSPLLRKHHRFLTVNSNRHMAELEMPVTCTKQRLRHFLIATFGAFFVLHLSSYKLIFTL